MLCPYRLIGPARLLGAALGLMEEPWVMLHPVRGVFEATVVYYNYLRKGIHIMAGKHRTFPAEFKRAAVQLLETSGKPGAQIARELGISDRALEQWRRQLVDQGDDAFPGNGHQTPLEEELRQLRREHERLRQEREILNKAISIFSTGPHHP